MIGYSGHAYVAIDIALSRNYTIVGYLEKAEKENNPFQLRYLGDDENILSTNEYRDASMFVAIGENTARSKIINSYKESHDIAILIHKSASINLLTEIGVGTLIASNVVINPLAFVGVGCIINTSAVVEHECMVEDFAHIAPGAILAGNVKVGKRSFIGANSVVKQGVKIGNDVIIGAGSVIINDVPDGVTVVGNPARVIKSN
jgi:sugar O-acyltransferase (sialic acid O-acetyltransferase NeuD family)